MRKQILGLVLAGCLVSAPALAQRIDQLPQAGGFGRTRAAPPKPMLSAPAPAPAPAPVAPSPEQLLLAEGIAAVVNEAVISTADVKARAALAALSAGLPDTPEVRQKLLPQVLRGLVDEQLQVQEGQKLDIAVSADEIKAAMKRIAEDNRIPGGDMEAFLKSRGVPSSTLKAQIKAALTWNKVVMREVRPRVDIGEDEIDAVIQRMRANAGKQEYLVSEIFLTVDKPEDEAEVKAFAEKLVEQLKGGALFGAVARQFSQGAGAATGGDIGWIQGGQLAPEVDQTMQAMTAGEIAGPVRSASGYHILGVREKRTIAVGDVKEMKVKLQQAFRSFGIEADKDAVLYEAGQIRKAVDGCEGLRDKLARDYPLWRWQDLGEVKMGAAPAWLADKIANVNDGQAAEPMATDKGALVLFVCGRDVPESVDRNAIRNAIGSERMELLARRLLRDLRRNAYLDLRLKAQAR